MASQLHNPHPLLSGGLVFNPAKSPTWWLHCYIVTPESTVSMCLSLGHKAGVSGKWSYKSGDVQKHHTGLKLEDSLFSPWIFAQTRWEWLLEKQEWGKWKRHREVATMRDWIQLAPRPGPSHHFHLCQNLDAPTEEKVLDSLSAQRLKQTMCSHEWAMDWEKYRIFTSDKHKMELPWTRIKMVFCREINLVVLTNGTCPNT